LIRNVWVIATDAGGLSEDIVSSEMAASFRSTIGVELEKAVKRLLDNPSRLDGYRSTRTAPAVRRTALNSAVCLKR
jgi:hypothetical protein